MPSVQPSSARAEFSVAGRLDCDAIDGIAVVAFLEMSGYRVSYGGGFPYEDDDVVVDLEAPSLGELRRAVVLLEEVGAHVLDVLRWERDPDYDEDGGMAYRAVPLDRRGIKR